MQVATLMATTIQKVKCRIVAERDVIARRLHLKRKRLLEMPMARRVVSQRARLPPPPVAEKRRLRAADIANAESGSH